MHRGLRTGFDGRFRRKKQPFLPSPSAQLRTGYVEAVGRNDLLPSTKRFLERALLPAHRRNLRTLSCVFGLLVSTIAHAEPTEHEILFYNARLALRDGRPSDALRLWLLKSSLVQMKGTRSSVEPDHRSVTWAALGTLGLCGDGFPIDTDGAGLWPLSIHNQIVATLVKGSPPSVHNPYGAFDVGRQQRLISLHDVLDLKELKTVTFFRTHCSSAERALWTRGEFDWVDGNDRLATLPVLRKLLELSLKTLSPEKVESRAVIEARIFDVDVAMVQLAERKARQKAAQAKAQGRRAGLSEAAVQENAARVRKWPEASSQAKFLKKSLLWNRDEWLALNPTRRQYLFAHAKTFGDPSQVQTLALSITDGLIAARKGDEVENMLGELPLQKTFTERETVFGGERGQSLLNLLPDSGFRERSVIALHRGVSALQSGQRLEALRAFGFSLAHAEESKAAQPTLALSRRWLSYVLSQYQTDEEVLQTLKALAPRQEVNSILEDLLWKAALRADSVSFESLAKAVKRGASLDSRIEKLRPLSVGDAGKMGTALMAAIANEPGLTLRFAGSLIEHIESEDADVRIANIATLKALRTVLEKISGRQTEAWLARIQSVLDGLKEFEDTAHQRGRSISPRRETFAGNVRLAPADELPWPFEAPTVSPASVFVPVKLLPLEWKGESKDELVFGWRISE